MEPRHLVTGRNGERMIKKKKKTGWIGRMALKDKNLTEAQRKFIVDIDSE